MVSLVGGAYNINKGEKAGSFSLNLYLSVIFTVVWCLSEATPTTSSAK